MYVYAKSICFISTHGSNILIGQISQRTQVQVAKKQLISFDHV